jgi:hypothetical protein
MKDFCICKDYKTLKKNNRELFKWHPPYGWVLSWIELTKERGYTQIHRYAVPIKYCPMCGRKADNDRE